MRQVDSSLKKEDEEERSTETGGTSKKSPHDDPFLESLYASTETGIWNTEGDRLEEGRNGDELRFFPA